MTVDSQISGKRKSPLFLFSLWALWSAAYMYLVWPRLAKPFIGWEYLIWELAKTANTAGISHIEYFYLPPLLEPLIALFFRLFGTCEASARLAGAASFIMLPPFVYFVASQIVPAPRRVRVTLIASLFLLASPALIQGSLLITKPDTTFFPVLLLLFYGALFASESRPPLLRFLIVSILFAALLWAKMTTALACFVALPLGCLIGRARASEWRVVIGGLAAGTAAFIAAWALFAALGPGMGRFSEPFAYCAGNGPSMSVVFNKSVLIKTMLDVVQVTLWLSPLFIALALAAAVRVLNRRAADDESRRECHLLAFIVVLFIGYGYANMTFANFPKYIVPAIPLLAIVAAKFVCEILEKMDRRKMLSIAAFLPAGIGYYLFTVGDWIYAIYLLRQGQLYGTLHGNIGSILGQQALYFLFPLILVILLRLTVSRLWRRCVIVALAFSFVSGGLALALIQRNARYSTQFGYGVEGGEMLHAYLNKFRPQFCLTSIEGYVAGIPQTAFGMILSDDWNDPDKFLEVIKKVKPPCIIYGLGCNTVRQLKITMRDKRVAAYLAEFYRHVRCGDYHLLSKRK